MGSAFHQLCPRYSGTLTPTAPTAIKLWDTFTFTFSLFLKFKDNFLYFSMKTYVVTPHENCLEETVLMMSHSFVFMEK